MNRGFEVLEKFKKVSDELFEKEGFTLLPRRSTEGSSGYDFRAAETVTINPGELKFIETGITAYMNQNEELQLRARSGLSSKYKLLIMNGVGTIDSDYYGNPIKFMYYNLGDEPFTINCGDRIGQGIFCQYLKTDDDQPVKTERTGGFGHTGVR